MTRNSSADTDPPMEGKLADLNPEEQARQRGNPPSGLAESTEDNHELHPGPGNEPVRPKTAATRTIIWKG